MLIQQKYSVVFMSLVGASLCSQAEVIPADDLLAGCAQVSESFKDAGKELSLLIEAFSNVANALNYITQQRQNVFNGYTQQLQNYQYLLSQEQEKLEQIKQQGAAEQGVVGSNIQQLNDYGNEEILKLESSIANLQIAIGTLQENLATISNLTQDRVDSVNAMISSYGEFQSVRVDFKDKLGVLLDQIRSYIGITAVQDGAVQG